MGVIKGVRLFSQAVKVRGVFAGFVSVESTEQRADTLIKVALRSKARDHSVQVHGGVMNCGFVRD